MNYNFLKYKICALLFSMSGLILVFFGYFNLGLNFGIDFKGGVVIEISNDQNNIESKFLAHTQEYGYKVKLQSKTDKILIWQFTKNNKCADNCVDSLKSSLHDKFSDINILRAEYVGPKASKYLIKNSIHAVIMAIIMMVIYIIIRFNYRYSIAAIIAIIHDVIFTIGFFIFSQYEFNLTSIAAILTIVGYSINDSVVIFDRIRENATKNFQSYNATIINLSINETMSRTIMTLLTTIAACGALWLFGGESLQSFSAATTFGIAFGTYSSIFVASSVLLYFKKSNGL